VKIPANSYARWVPAAFFGMVAAFSIPTIFAPGKGGVALQLMSPVFACALVFLAYRSVTANVSIDGSRVTYRSYIRIRHWPRSAVRSFEARNGRVGMLGYARQVVWITLRDANKEKLEMLNFGPRDQGVREVVASLNAGLTG
jgi:hypothetical protein